MGGQNCAALVSQDSPWVGDCTMESHPHLMQQTNQNIGAENYLYPHVDSITEASNFSMVAQEVRVTLMKPSHSSCP